MPDSLYELFRQCTVRISTSAKIQGTGFFVAPGLVLTCAHVLQTEGSSQQLSVTILWNHQTYSAHIEQIRDIVYPDIALLRVDCPAHPCVHMDEDIELFDKLYCYGYPDDYPNGDSATLEYEGPADEQSPLLKLKSGQIRPAFSGAPLLNIRTGRVCGIVKRTRNRDQPTGGRAIPTATVFQEFEQVKIAQQQMHQENSIWNGTSLEEAQEASSPIHLAHDVTSYFSLLTTFLASEGRWFQHDFEQGRIYIPEKEYFAKLAKVLTAKHRVLLFGNSAAGKTVLAISFAKYLQEQAHYIVCYKDVRQAESGDGRKWHALMIEHNQPGILYILDNCHLAPGVVDEFCRQWKDLPPKDTQCLLISRANQQEARDEEGSYFRMFSEDEKIQVRSEDIFWQIIEQYVTTLHQQDSGYSIALKSDNVETLTEQHAHNLVISRSRLDAWQILGAEHRLSEVQQADTYQALEKKYLSVYGTALATLCILQRYEIRVHTFFVEKKLPPDEVEQLKKEKLLIHSRITGYGQLYDLVLHPSEARELFIAYVFNQYGDVTREYINQLVISTLETYLQTKPLPPNYITVYESLARHKQEDISKHLLSNHALQEYTISQFNKETVLDAIRYVYRVAKVDVESAAKIMKRVVRISGIEGICSKLLKNTFQDVALLLQYVNFIDSELAHRIADALNIAQLARQAKEESIQSLFRLVRTLHEISPSQAQMLLLAIPVEVLIAKTTIRNLQDTIKQLQEYDYASSQLKQFIELLDMPRFAQQSESISLQSLFWTLHALKKVSSTQAQTLLACIPLQVVSMKASASNLGSIDRIVHIMQEYGYTIEQLRTFVEGLDMEQVAHHAQQGNLRRLTSLLRTLKPLSASTVMKLLETLAPGDIAELFQRSPLGAIGSFLQYQYANRHVQAGYALFQEQFLKRRLETEPLSELNEFLDSVHRIRHRGPLLVHHVLNFFVATDITERIALADLQQFVRLLQHARSIDKAYFPKLLAPLHQSAIVQTHLAKSDLHTIQLFIFNVATMDEAYLQPIQQALSTSSIIEKLEEAPVRDIGLFLWNVYRYIDKQMAQEYNVYVDQHYRAKQFNKASPADICFFLWNLTSISDVFPLRIFDEPMMQQLLLNGWDKDIGWSVVLAGIATIAQAPVHDGKFLSAVQIQAEALSSWFTESSGGRNPYFLVLALQGLRACNEEVACIVVPSILPLSATLSQLKSARASAITPCSVMLIEEMQQWLCKLLEGEEGTKRTEGIQ